MASDAQFAEAERSPSISPPLNFTDESRVHAQGEATPEIGCLRGRVAADVLADAERRAADVGVGADRVLIAAGVVSEEDYLRTLADALGLTFDSLDGIARNRCPLDDDRLIEAVAAGILPLKVGGELCLVVAPRGTAVRRIIALVDDNPELARRLRFTSAERLTQFVFRHGAGNISARAAEGLKTTWPALSAAPPRWRANVVPVALILLALLAVTIAAPAQTAIASEVLLAVVFLAWLALRLIGAFVAWAKPDPPLDLRDDELPVYTVISALYREAASVDALLTAIERLDYPPEKLDVKLVVEADDVDTRAAISARKSRLPLEVIVSPPQGPRTKPKALNVALPFARGSFTVIYDAEDRPEAGQLKRALSAFCAAGGDDLACVQACLCVDNTADSWLARLYTAEYAGQFDVFLPGIAALRLPLPLGGSSNHFRTATLRKVGGWDPYNVTEDADLGMRLARFGYRASVIDSTTYEEAPARFGPWLRQRTRWFKGWMQTWLVHMREPRELLANLGLPGFAAFQLIVGGNALAALVHPLFLLWLIYGLKSGAPMGQDGGATVTILAGLYGTTVVIGYGTSAFLGWFGLARRGLLSTAWVLLLTPLHWLLLSLAAWRALYQLIAAPYRWEKTEHGLARNSRLAERASQSLSKLERYLSGIDFPNIRTTLAPEQAANATYISADRPPRRRVSA
jgi:cellulose synthase/poly-beta-1,6-N-acetylglucosamine synthase-like glycosyltransferase